MNVKHIVIIGIILFLLAFILPPYQYQSVNKEQTAQTSDPVTHTTFRPIWNGTEIYDLHGNLIGEHARFNALLWLGILFVIGMGTRTIIRFKE